MKSNKYFCPNNSSYSDELPDTRHALKEPDGLLAFGGSLEKNELLRNYIKGAFPWFNKGQPIIWWSPSKRLCLLPKNLKINRALQKKVKSNRFSISKNLAFGQVIEKCSNVHDRKNNTWITGEIKKAYLELHQTGHAHSIECWKDNQLVGGLYGVSIGQIFFGESMFSLESDASKLALVALCERNIGSNYHLIDCQIESMHLKKLGAALLERSEFEKILMNFCVN